MSALQYIDLVFRKSLVPFNNLWIKNNPADKELIEELRKKANEISMPTKTELADSQWLGNILKLKKQILAENPKNFLQWDVIRKTMFIGNALFTLREFLYLRQHNWTKWKKAIVEKNYVFTEPYLLYPKTSGNFVHQAHHIAKFEQISGKKIPDFDFIFEFGGGYGAMCQLIHNLGFQGKYIIFDLPIFSALQTFFLKMNGLNVSLNSLDKKAKILCLNNINEVKKIIPKGGKKLFLANWSLSESPLRIRKKVFPLIKGFNSHLIGYQNAFGETENCQYFRNYQKNLGKLQWWNQEIPQLKNNYYLFGFKS